MTNKVKNNCKWCGREFETDHDSMAFCSSECKDLYYREYKDQILRPCEMCGGLFHPEHRNDRYCSPKCLSKAQELHQDEITITLTKDEIKPFRFVKDTDILNNEVTIFLEETGTSQAADTIDDVIWKLIHKSFTIDWRDEC